LSNQKSSKHENDKLQQDKTQGVKDGKKENNNDDYGEDEYE
jgi:hypothetical protein